MGQGDRQWWKRSGLGWTLAGVGALAACTALLLRAFRADDTDFERLVGWANILALVVSGLGLALVCMRSWWLFVACDQPRLPDGLVFGLLAGLSGFAIGAGAAVRYGLAIGVMAVQGKLPWRFEPFLDWTCVAGLMRVSGIAYQFRHRELQDWLVRPAG